MVTTGFRTHGNANRSASMATAWEHYTIAATDHFFCLTATLSLCALHVVLLINFNPCTTDPEHTAITAPS